MTNVAENMFQAVDILVNKKLEGLGFDRTEQATIIDDSKADKGQYTVQTETVTYKAFSENTQYRNKQEVLITIPNSNYNNKKMILGLANQETEISTTEFVDPLSGMLNITGSLIDPSGSGQMIANDMRVTQMLIGSWSCEEDQELNGYNRVGVSAEFQTLLGDLNVVKGRYGLKLYIYSKSSDEKEYISELDFNNKNFYGNSFNIPGYQRQSMIADIGKLKDIYKVELYFYQHRKGNKGSFYDIENSLVPYQDSKNRYYAANLKIRQPMIIFGYAVEDYNNDQAILYTADSLVYNIKKTGKTNVNSLKRNLELRWISLDNNGKPFVYNEIPDNTIIRWYRKNDTANAPDSYVGYGWEVLQPKGNNNIYIPSNLIWDADRSQFYSKYDEEQKDSLSNNTEYFSIEDNEFIYYNQSYCKKFNEIIKEVILNQNVSKEIYKVIILTPEQTIVSKTISFENQGDVIDKTSVKYSKGLGYRFDDGGFDGRYSFYGPDGQILNSSLLKDRRKIILTFDGEDLKEAQKITWDLDYLNTKVSMINIVPFYENNEEKNYDFESSNDYNEELNDPYGTLVYTLRSSLNMAQAAQSFIKCEVTFSDVKYSVIIPFNFGRDTSLEYTFDAEIYRKINDGYIPVPAVVFSGDKTVGSYYIKPIIYNKSGIQVETTEISTLEVNIPSSIDEDFNNFTIELQKMIDGYYPLKFNGFNGKKYNTSYIELILSDKLVKKVPIPIASDSNYMMLGLSEIVYNSAGYPPLSQVGYKLISRKTGEILDGIDINLSNGVKENPEFRFLPSISKNSFLSNKEQYLLLPSLYVTNLNTIPSLTFLDSNTQEVLWSQPIIFSIEDHSSNLLNDWDGGLRIDKNVAGGAVMSKAMGAGKLDIAKDGSKAFSGVVLGDLSDGGDTSLKNTGLYGYHEGVQAFAFKDDGTAFIGKPNEGRIVFDGNKSTITSANYKENSRGVAQQGMKIDLDDGFIKAATLNLQDKLYITNDGKLYIDPTAILSSLNNNAMVEVTYALIDLQAEGSLESKFAEASWYYYPVGSPDETKHMYQRIVNKIYDDNSKAWIDNSDSPTYVDLYAQEELASLQNYLRVKDDGLHITGYHKGYDTENNRYVYKKSYGESVYSSDGIVFYGKTGTKTTDELSRWTQDEMSLKNLNKFSLSDLLLQKESNGSYSIVRKEE